jgi:hypothetical protein
MTAHLRERWLQLAILLGCALLCVLFALAVLAVAYGIPQVVSCLDGEGYTPGSPATNVEVSFNRRGGVIVERHALACTWYFHEGRGLAD